MAISATGLGSGLDIKSLVDQLVSAERQPVATRLATQEARATAQLTAIGRLKGALSAFEDAAAGLADVEQFQKRSATSSEPDRVTATADTDATPASYEIEILSLATSQRLASGPFASAGSIVGEGQLTIGVGAASMQIEITSANSTLAGIRDAINASTNNPGVRASIVTAADGAHLVLAATATGAANTITVDAVAPGSPLEVLEFGAGTTNALSQLTAASDASVRIDGLAVASTTNSLDGAIEGVAIDLLEAEPGAIVRLDIDYDRESARAAINSFVEAYNDVVGLIGSLTAYDPETRAAGPLLGDAATRQVRSALREVVGRTVGDASAAYRTLAEIGITTGTDGKLGLDAAKLDAALDTDFDALGKLFGDEDRGIAVGMASVVEDFLASDGRIGARESTLRARLEDIGDRRSELEARMEQLRRRYQNQFNALDRLVGQLNQTSSFLTQQLARL